MTDTAGKPAQPPRVADLWRRAAWIIPIAAVLVVILLTVPGLASVRRHLAHGNPGWLAAAACFRLASAFAFAVVFRAILAPHLSRRLSYRIAMSEIGVNALLPAGGTGGLAVGGWALHRLGMSATEVVERSATVFVFTSAFNVGAVALVGWLGGLGVLGVGSGGAVLALTLIPAIAATAVIVVALLLSPRLEALQARQAKHRTHSIRWWLLGAGATVGSGAHGAVEVFRAHRLWPLAAGAGYLLFDIATLWAAVRAFHGHTRAGSLAMGYLIGQLGGAVPIPGGIGAVSGGLIGALSVYGLPVAVATASTIAYRAIALAVPVLFGGIALIGLTHTIRSTTQSALTSEPGEAAGSRL